MRRSIRAGGEAIAASLLGVLLVACTSSPPSATGSVRPSVTASADASPASSPPAPSTSLPPVLSPPTCLDATMGTSVASSQGGAGTIRSVVRSTNTSGHTCLSQGYPGMDFHASTGWLNVQVHRGGFADINGSPQAQTVSEEQSLYFVVYWHDMGPSGAPCIEFDKLKVTLPNNFVSNEVAASGCVTPSSVDVGPVTTTAPAP